MSAILDNITLHWVVYSTAGIALATATISCMPPKFPRGADEWWAWFRTSLQTAIPARHNPVHPEPVQAPNPILPVGPALTQK